MTVQTGTKLLPAAKLNSQDKKGKSLIHKHWHSFVASWSHFLWLFFFFDSSTVNSHVMSECNSQFSSQFGVNQDCHTISM